MYLLEYVYISPIFWFPTIKNYTKMWKWTTPNHISVVRDKAAIKKIASCKSLGGSQIIGADDVVVVMVNLDRGEFWIEDGAIASSYILLAAEQYDIGACWVHIRNRTGKKKSSDEEIRELLGVPDGYVVLNLIALWGKGEQKPGYSESGFDFSKIHQESFWCTNSNLHDQFINV